MLALLAPASLTGCVYRMNIQQGNYLDGKTVDQLKVGMTRSQVRYLLGTPMVPEPSTRIAGTTSITSSAATCAGRWSAT